MPVTDTMIYHSKYISIYRVKKYWINPSWIPSLDNINVLMVTVSDNICNWCFAKNQIFALLIDTSYIQYITFYMCHSVQYWINHVQNSHTRFNIWLKNLYAQFWCILLWSSNRWFYSHRLGLPRWYTDNIGTWFAYFMRHTVQQTFSSGWRHMGRRRWIPGTKGQRK